MSQLTAKLRWKVTAVFETEPPICQENVLFNLSPNTGLYSQFSIPLWHSYVPQVLSPTVTFHQVIKNLLRKNLDVEVTDKKFPYRVFVPQINAEVLLNMQLRLFPPSILSLTVKLSDVPTNNLDVARLIDYQRLDYLRPISDVTQWAIGMVETLNHKNFNPSQPLRFKPAIHLDGICPSEEFEAHLNENLSKYIGILIRNYDYELMDRQIPDRILEKNREHNRKSQELLLIDKQGILYLTPSRTEKKPPTRPSFSRTYDLYGLALVFSDYISNYYPLRLHNEDLADFILYKIRPWIDEPKIIFSASKTNIYRWNLLVDEFGLKSRMHFIMTQTAMEDAIAAKSKYFDQFANGWWNESDFGYLIARRISESQELQLGFLEDEDLKKLIIEDYGEARRSFQSKNYKATMLLCGSIAEAILTAVLDRVKLSGTTAEKLVSAHPIQKLAQLMQARQEQGEPPYVLLLGSSLSLTPAVRHDFASTEDWEAFWTEMQRAAPTERKVLLKGPLNALGLEKGYRAMAWLAKAGYFDLILTLNVDDAIDDAVRPLPADQSVLLIYDGSNAAQIVKALSHSTPRIKVIKLRGDINAQALPLTDTGQFGFPEDLERFVSELIRRDTILLGDIPYDTDVQHCIKRSGGALWCILPDEPASDSFIMRAKKIRPSGEIITGVDVGFNTFFTVLAERLQKLYYYELDRLIEIAKEHSLITDETLFSLLKPLRHYRNTIHPRVHIRQGLSPDSSKARIAIETINLLVKDLNRNYKRQYS